MASKIGHSYAYPGFPNRICQNLCTNVFCTFFLFSLYPFSTYSLFNSPFKSNFKSANDWLMCTSINFGKSNPPLAEMKHPIVNLFWVTGLYIDNTAYTLPEKLVFFIFREPRLHTRNMHFINAFA